MIIPNIPPRLTPTVPDVIISKLSPSEEEAAEADEGCRVQRLRVVSEPRKVQPDLRAEVPSAKGDTVSLIRY